MELGEVADMCVRVMCVLVYFHIMNMKGILEYFLRVCVCTCTCACVRVCGCVCGAKISNVSCFS